MIVESVTCEWDEGGLDLVLEHEPDGGGFTRTTFRFRDPEELYDAVRGAVAPWLYERDSARGAFDNQREEADAYDLTDPKHPRHHEVFAALIDTATKGER